MLHPRDRALFTPLESAVYLDTAGSGLVTPAAFQAAEEFRRISIAGVGHVEFAADAEPMNALYEGLRSAAARLIAADTRDIAVISSSSEALSQIAWGLALSASENVVVLRHDFPTLTYPWLRVSRTSGLEVRLIEPDSRGQVAIETILEHIDANTRVLAISHVHFLTGQRHDLAALSEITRRRQIHFVVDASQSAGCLPLSVDGIDVLVCSSGKWLCSGYGAAFAFIAPAIAETIDPPFFSWHSGGGRVVPGEDQSATLAPGARRLEYATIAFDAVAALTGGIEYLIDLGLPAITQHNADLLSELNRGMTALGYESLSRNSNVIAYRHCSDTASIGSQLRSEGVIIREIEWEGRTLLRFSPHFYNTHQDISKALDVIRNLTAGRRHS